MLLSLLRWHWIQNIEQKTLKLKTKTIGKWQIKWQKEGSLNLIKEHVENVGLYNPVMYKIMNISKEYIKYNFVAPLRQKTSKSVWYDQFLEVPVTMFSKKGFPKLDFLKVVPVTMIANSEKMKTKKSHYILVAPADFFKKFLTLHTFLETSSSTLKKGVGRGRKLMCFQLKIYAILFI